MIYKDFQKEKLSMLGFGTMRLPLLENGNVDEAQVREMTRYAIEHGVNYFDTAFPYHNGDSERVIGRVLKEYPRDSFYLATKYPGHQILSNGYHPEEIFEEGYISKLFHITSGTFDETTTGMELKAAEGSPKVFVIAGGGTGRRAFRYLQRAGVPFATGILYENDLDYPVAKALAGSVIGAAAFEPVRDTLLDEAKKSIRSCAKVICTKAHFAALEKYNEQLLEYAKVCEKDIKIWQK